jgi:hypothetical protein
MFLLDSDYKKFQVCSMSQRPAIFDSLVAFLVLPDTAETIYAT